MSRLPKGCINVGGSMASAMEKSRQLFISSFSSFGYKPFWPPAFQLLETAWDRLPESMRTRLMAISTPFGEPCCLRADITMAAVAYLSAQHTPEERPLRLCYSDRIYKVPQPPATGLETFQIGAELLGWEGGGADVEVLSILLKSMDRIGISDAHIVLGDAKIVQKIMDEIPSRVASKLILCLEKGSYSKYFKVLQETSVPKSTLPFLEALPHLKGNSSVLLKGGDLLGDDSIFKPLSAIGEELRKLGYGDRISFDLALTRELNYYSGPIFDLYSPRFGKALGGGGRYDGLLFKYGIFGQAIGFALDLKSVASISSFGHGNNETPAVMLWPGTLSPANTLKSAWQLASRGCNIEISWTSSKEESIRLTRTRHMEWWADLSLDKITNIISGEKFSLKEWNMGGCKC